MDTPPSRANSPMLNMTPNIQPSHGVRVKGILVAVA